METSAITESVFSIFIIILIGVYGSKRKIITPEINKGLTDILIKIALPFMILSSFIFTYDYTIKSNVLKTFYYSLGAYIIMAGISFLMLIPVKKDKKTVLHFANVFVNTGYIGFPILNSIYGSEGVIYGSIFNIFFVVFVWTYGIMLYKGKLEKGYLKKEIICLLLNPSIIAVIIGIIIMILEIEIKGALLNSIKSIGNITGPISMFIIGVILSNVKIQYSFKDWTLYYEVAIKLIIIPLMVYFIFLLLVEPTKAVYSVIIMSAMPASAMTSILAENFNKEKEYAAIVVSATTLMSMLTIPLLIRLIM